jgi:serine/threonine-protein kinase
MEMLLAHAYESPVPPADLRGAVPADLEAVVLRCLAKKREERYEDVDQLEKALGACAASELWTEERARAWWRIAATEPDTHEHAALATTPRGG